MSRIKTHRGVVHSIFQSLVEDVAGRIEARDGARLGAPAPDESTAAAPRRSAGHVAHDIAARIVERRTSGEPVPDTPPADLQAKHGGAVQSLWNCAKLSAESLSAKMLGHHEKAQEKHDELKFSSCDPLWAGTLLEYEKYFGVSGGRREIPYVRYQSLDDFVLDSLPPDATIALLGDWATGTDEAIALLEAVAKHEPDVVIHLGDIYYSGTESETHKFFLELLNEHLPRDPAAPGGRKIPVYTLTGNHDMYSGGVGYYALLPELNPVPAYDPGEAQPASYFCLRGSSWQLLAMDTGYHDHDPFEVTKDVTYLEPSEEDWHADKIARFAADGGRTILLSHHQLFSAFEKIGEGVARPAGEEATNFKLLDSFRRFQQAARDAGVDPESRDIAAWFWGHEHKLAVYEPYMGLRRGCCMGHGAIPDFLDDGSYAVDPSLPTPPRLVDDPSKPGDPLVLAPVDQVYAHGFAILKLDDAARTARASFYQETDWSRPMYEEEL